MSPNPPNLASEPACCSLRHSSVTHFLHVAQINISPESAFGECYKKTARSVPPTAERAERSATICSLTLTNPYPADEYFRACGAYLLLYEGRLNDAYLLSLGVQTIALSRDHHGEARFSAFSIYRRSTALPSTETQRGQTTWSIVPASTRKFCLLISHKERFSTNPWVRQTGKRPPKTY